MSSGDYALTISGLPFDIPSSVEVCVRLGQTLSELIDQSNSNPGLRVMFKCQWTLIHDILITLNRINLDRISSRFGVPLETEMGEMILLLRERLIKAVERASRMRSASGKIIITQVAWPKPDLE